MEYWIGVKIKQEEHEDDSQRTGTTWVELTLDFIATTGIIPCSLDYAATNIESATLSFKTLSQRIFNKHGTHIQLNIRSNRRLESLGLDKNTGISAAVALNHQPYVMATLLHRVYVQEQNYENKDRFKYWPHYNPPNQPAKIITFTTRRGIMEGNKFSATLDHVTQLPNDIIQGQRKYTSRAEIARNIKRQVQPL